MPLGRTLRVSEKRLDLIREAAASGVPQHRIGPALGMTPDEFAALAVSSDLVQRAIDEGHARGEYDAAMTLRVAAQDGNIDAAKTILTHKYGWKAKADEDAGKVQEAQAMMDYAKLNDEELARLEALLAKGLQGNVVPIK